MPEGEGDALRVLERADRAYHDVAQYHLHEFEAATDGGHVGPIVFSNETARSQLVEHGSVISFRASDRTTGKTWWRESRTGPKKGDVWVTKLRPVDASNPEWFEICAEMSGFESAAAWRDAISDIHGGEPTGFLYYVRER